MCEASELPTKINAVGSNYIECEYVELKKKSPV